MRMVYTIIVMEKKWMHICDEKQKAKRWYPLTPDGDLVTQVEHVFVAEGLAHNLVNLEEKVKNFPCVEYTVTVNTPEQDSNSEKIMLYMVLMDCDHEWKNIGEKIYPNDFDARLRDGFHPAQVEIYGIATNIDAAMDIFNAGSGAPDQYCFIAKVSSDYLWYDDPHPDTTPVVIWKDDDQFKCPSCKGTTWNDITLEKPNKCPHCQGRGFFFELPS